MGTRYRLYKIIILISLIGINPAIANDNILPPLHFNGRYAFDWSGITLGKLAVSVDEGKDRYKLRLIVASAGATNLFTHHMSDTVATGRREGNTYFPEYYESYYKTKQKPRHIKLEFNKKGVVTTEINEPPEDRNDRPEIPHALKDGSYDPLTGFMALRSGDAKLPAFDAKRLYEIYARKGSSHPLYREKTLQNALPFTLSRTPLAGLTAKELREYAKGEPEVTLYLSNDQRRIPLAMSMPILLGSVHGVLIKECKEWNDCAIDVNVK